MTFTTPNKSYWDNKFVAYMHDPFDKAFHIPGHEGRSAKLISLFGLEQPNQKYWSRADGLASGFERGQLPSYDRNETMNGAVEFKDQPILTHPTSEPMPLEVILPESLRFLTSAQCVSGISDALVKAIQTILEKGEDGVEGYASRFKGDPERFAAARFFYTHLALRFKLAEDNVASLGALWHRLPADTRFPDHSIWQHNALTSAFYSCMELARNERNIGMMVLSITPVQAFIGRARKLRDFWSGSVILSWLAFEGIRWVCENLGPDHLLYPSLIDQPLMNEYLMQHWEIDDIASLNPNRDIASFPNKFLFLIPLDMADAIAEGIQSAIQAKWISLCDRAESLLGNLAEEKREPLWDMDVVHEMFQRQAHDYWDISWGAVRIIAADDDSLNEMKRVVPETGYRHKPGQSKLSL